MTLTPATIKVGDGTAQPVQFNPASLRVTTTNQLEDDHPNQVSKPTSFKLDVELLFDSTEEGSDIFVKTRAIRDAATASAQGATARNQSGGSAGGNRSGNASANLALVTFSWGTTHYQGYIESLNETLDYWSSDGVPLRSTIQISLKGTTENFLTGTYGNVARASQNPAPELPSIVATSVASDQARFTRAAAEGGDGGSTGRGLAALNGVENMRGGAGVFAGASAGAFASAGAGASAGAFAGAGAGAFAGAGGGMSAGAGAQLQAAAGFKLAGGVSAGASLGFGVGASAGLSASAGLGASVGVGMAAGAGFGAGASAGAGIGFGAGASAAAGFGAVAGVAAGASAGFGMTAGAGAGFSSGGGFAMTTSTSITGFDGVTRTTTTSRTTGFDGVTRTSTASSELGGGMAWGSASAGVTASAGAFAGLGQSRTTLPSAGFDPDRLLPPPLPGGGVTTRYDVSGRAVSADGQVAASYSARAAVTVW